MLILGLHFGSHDAGAAIVRDGELVAMMEQERFDHVKHSNSFPHGPIEYCLREAGASLSDVDVVAYANDVAMTNEFKRQFIAAQYPGALVPEFRTQADVEKELFTSLNRDVPTYFTDHHSAHAASVFHLSPYDESAIFTVDGMGNWVTTTTGYGRGNEIRVIDRTPHPHSIGLLYGAVTQYLGFKADCDEGKTMGLAAYGKPVYLEAFREICSIQEERLALDLDYFSFHRRPLAAADGEITTWYAPAFVERFGPFREPEAEITTHHRNMAASAQAFLEETCFGLLNGLHAEVPLKSLCLAGGVALNCSMNGKIADNTPFESVFIMPASGDAGICIGAALDCAVRNDPAYRRHPLKTAYLGSAHETAEIEEAMKSLPSDSIVEKPSNLVERTADLLEKFSILGWYQGRMEFGPRALGNRSILANPRKAEIKDIVNAKVKFREDFRPFAPIVPLESAPEYFEMDCASPFMLKVTKVRDAKRDMIPAVTHVDGTARVQTIERDDNPMIYELLLSMGRRNDVPVLLNTSFNIRGDTVVRTPQDALDCFLRTGMDALAIGPFLITKTTNK